ncbi:MAG: ImmA/IrrE family metallo-endopeptidase [Nocardioides sp.]|uniref:ImmA/IrrE family metallo-endopeptidase n=1 Tax=Nocardioides sp. TaxID=35761 RepID=UPI00326673E0
MTTTQARKRDDRVAMRTERWNFLGACSVVPSRSGRCPARRLRDRQENGEVIDVMVWEAAREQATKLRQEHQTSDPYVIARELGLDVIETVTPVGMAGMIVKKRGEAAQIFIDSSDVPGRRRFTCAHELGHFVERENIARDDDFSFRDERGGRYDLHEFFADEFAGELLMPAHDFERLEREGATTTTIAHTFGVSTTAVERRRDRLRKNPARSWV